MDQSDAEELITFSGLLLRFIYEYPAKMKIRAEGAGAQAEGQV
jgi:hypothetical protein